MNEDSGRLRQVFLVAAVALVVLAAALAAAALWGRSRAASPAPSGPERAGEAGAVPVKTVRPKPDPSYTVRAANPCYVHPYYQVDLEAQVPGVVEKLTKDVGDPVTKGEEILRLSAPDLAADVKVKEAQIADQKNALELARSREKLAGAAVATAQAAAKEAESGVATADYDAEFRRTRAQRFEGLVKQEATIPDVAAETAAEAKKAAASATGARDTLARAQAEISEATAKLEEARADIKVKQSEIDQAVAERAKAQALLDFAALKAPWDGIIVRRMVDPGRLVANSSSGHSEPLLRLQRTDILTVVANFPDVYAPSIGRGTEAELTLSDLPGVTVRGKVTRFAPTLQTQSNDQTMEVQVDLYVGTEADYQRFIQTVGATREGLKGGELPLRASPVDAAGAAKTARLLPGMYGNMTLILNRFADAFLLPSGAVFRQGGESYVFLVKDGKAVRTRVEVQFDDGKEVKLRVAEGGGQTREPRPGDEVINSNQGELRDGQAVRPSREEW
jgi:multidrug resistance efflux pump